VETGVALAAALHRENLHTGRFPGERCRSARLALFVTQERAYTRRGAATEEIHADRLR